MTRKQLIVAAVTGALLSATGPAIARAGPTWTPPVQFAADAPDPQVAMNARGDSVITWRSGGLGAIQVSVRDAGSSTWSVPVTITEGSLGALPYVDPAGNTIVAYAGPLASDASGSP